MDSGDQPMPIMPGPRWRNTFANPHRPQPPPLPPKWPGIPGALRYPAPIPYMRPIFRKKFMDALPTTEHYFHGDYTMSGGLFGSMERAPCHILYTQFKKTCMPPCALKNADGECYLRDAEGQCICVDPCQLLNNRRFFHQEDYYFGHESTESDCEFCVSHKADNWGTDIGWRGGPRDGRQTAPPWVRGGVKPQPRWNYEGSPFSCGYCDNQCVSGTRYGPVPMAEGDANYAWLGGNDCGGTWSWGLHDCRRHLITPEDERGSEVEALVQGKDELTGGAEAEQKSDDITDAPPEGGR
eukprot:g741.t1